MSSDVSPGPEVAPHEDLYRGLTTKDWWVAEEKRPSSAAFTFPRFSVDIASIASQLGNGDGPSYTLSHLPMGSGLISLNCGQARGLGFNARQELDPTHPENIAHASVYCDLPTSQRKKRAQKLVELCVGRVHREPTFES